MHGSLSYLSIISLVTLCFLTRGSAICITKVNFRMLLLLSSLQQLQSMEDDSYLYFTCYTLYKITVGLLTNIHTGFIQGGLGGLGILLRIYGGQPPGLLAHNILISKANTNLMYKNFNQVNNWASKASPTLGCSIEISRDIYICRSVGPSVGMSVVSKNA